MKKISPMLAVLVDEPFDRKEWIFETKWDGYRTFAHKNKAVELHSRAKQTYTARFPSIVEELKKLPGRFILDGEMVILDKAGRSHFQLLQNYQRHHEGTPYYYVFDILSLNGKDLHSLPLLKRKELLKNFLKKASLPHIKFSSHIEEKGIRFYKKALKTGLEGIVAKKADSPYKFKKSSDWQKIKASLRQEMVIGGFTAPRGSRKYFGALLVGVQNRKGLQYAGHVGGGFDRKRLKEVYEELKPLAKDKCPFFDEPKTNETVTWIKPTRVCEVSFAEWTSDGKLRQPIFRGMRSDKPASQVVREKPKRFAKI